MIFEIFYDAFLFKISVGALRFCLRTPFHNYQSLQSRQANDQQDEAWWDTYVSGK